MQLPNKLTFIDVETTGCRINDRIIEIGILRVEDNQLVETYHSLINPNCSVPDEILQMTGINPVELEMAPTFGQVKKDMLPLFQDSIFVAHNARFDYSFIRNEFKMEEISFKSKQLCTVKLSRLLFPKERHHNLDALIERFGFDCKNRHRALDDAKVLWDFYQKIQVDFPEEVLGNALSLVLKKPTVPVNIKSKIMDNLPEAAGVYIFYGKNGMPLYIGKSVNIRDRVLSHFSSDHLSSTELNISQQVESIETIVTAGELGALIKESFLIKKMQPLYNRKLRNSFMMMVLKSEMNKAKYNAVKEPRLSGAYKTVCLDTADQVDVNNLDQILGVFRNKKSIKEFLRFLAKEYELCEKLLGVDTTNSACFGYRLGKCKGACVDKENPAKYNLRFIEAFQKTKLRPWPFPGPVIVTETNEIEGLEDGFMIDKWCYVGTVKNGQSVEEVQYDNELKFDVDTYKILLSFMALPKNMKKIKLLKNPNLEKKDFSPDNSLISLA